ncbi:MAG: DUF370 domain-containing protein [Oscillospiraceae bacterium]|jgi:hypothetical protein|nr:DUF370 domain-containing protein [Oscillospiraceae bacterium]
MYLFLGQECVVSSRDVIGIFDLDNASTSRVTKSYLAKAQRDGRIIEVATDIPKSFVVCEHKGETRCYLSQISPSTLRKRAFYIKEIANL